MDDKANDELWDRLSEEPQLTDSEIREAEIAEILWEESEAEGGVIEIPEEGNWGGAPQPSTSPPTTR